MDEIESAANSFNTHSDRKDAYTEQFKKATAEMLRIVTEELEALKKQAVQIGLILNSPMKGVVKL